MRLNLFSSLSVSDLIKTFERGDKPQIRSEEWLHTATMSKDLFHIHVSIDSAFREMNVCIRSPIIALNSNELKKIAHQNEIIWASSWAKVWRKHSSFGSVFWLNSKEKCLQAWGTGSSLGPILLQRSLCQAYCLSDSYIFNKQAWGSLARCCGTECHDDGLSS